MKITTQLLRSKARGRGPSALHLLEYLDLSNLGLECVEKLHLCTKLQILKLNDNNIDYVDNLDVCSQLWNVNLANNKIKNLGGLRRIVALGCLDLANNDLGWAELNNIRHMIILHLNLHGNQQLEKEPSYRMHVIDCLPNIWMLDGRIVTSAEREQARQFFEDSELTSHPVRHKLSPGVFTASIYKNIQVSGVFGERTKHLLLHFPLQTKLNIDMDRRRLWYLASNMQTDFQIEAKATGRKFFLRKDYLEHLLESRGEDCLRTNILLLLLVASLQFAIPLQLMQETLNATKLLSLGPVDVIEMFLLPKISRCLVVSLLLSAVKVDKDVGKEKYFHDQLYLYIYHAVCGLIRLAHSSHVATSEDETGSVTRKASIRYQGSKRLVAAEVLQLMCVVPTFFDYCTKDTGIKNMLVTASANSTIVEQVAEVLKQAEQEKGDTQRATEEAFKLMVNAIKSSAFSSVNNGAEQARCPIHVCNILDVKRAIPRRPKSSSLYFSAFHAAGKPSPDRRPPWVKKGDRQKPKDQQPQPCLGDRILLGPQNIGRIISMPEYDIVLVQMDIVPAETGAMVNNVKNPKEHYTYVDMKQLCWDAQLAFWRPAGTIGGRITMRPATELTLERVASAPVTAAPGNSPPASRPNTGVSNLLAKDSYTDQRQVKLTHKSAASQLREILDLKANVSSGGRSSRSSSISSTQCKPAAEKEWVGKPGLKVDPGHQTLTTAQLPWSAVAENGGDQLAKKTRRDAMNSAEVEKQQASRMLRRRSSFESKDEVELHALIVGESHVENADHSAIRSAETTALAQDLSPQPDDEEVACVENDLWTTQSLQPLDPSAAASEESAMHMIDIPQMVPEVVTDTEQLNKDRSERLADLLRDPPEDTEQENDANVEVDHGPPTAPPQCSPKNKKTRQIQTQKRSSSRPRPVSAMDMYRLVVGKQTPHYIPICQNARTETQNKGRGATPSSSQLGSRPESPPPQRPPSPSDKNNRGKHAVSIKRGNSWLGDGRDLYWESVRGLPQPGSRQAGWKEGLPRRPHTAATVRTLRPIKPSSTNPSSLLATKLPTGYGKRSTKPEQGSQLHASGVAGHHK